MRSCARCGKTGILGAACATRGGVRAYYCHDADRDLDCYTLSHWAGFPELDLDQ